MDGRANSGPYFRPATLPNPTKSDLKTAAASGWADNKVYTWQSLRGTELVIIFTKCLIAILRYRRHLGGTVSATNALEPRSFGSSDTAVHCLHKHCALPAVPQCHVTYGPSRADVIHFGRRSSGAGPFTFNPHKL